MASTPDDRGDRRVDQPDQPDQDWNEAAGTFEGRTFPSEAEWLNLSPEALPPIGDDFVARTMAAWREEQTPEAGSSAKSGTVAGHLLTPDLLAAFAAPEPSRNFVADTLRAVQNDRRSRWRELLAKYIAPEPSPAFVARTLAALATDAQSPNRQARADQQARGRRKTRAGTAADAPEPRARWRVLTGWAIPTVAAAAAVIAFLLLQPKTPSPLEQRVAESAPPSFASTYAATPLPAVLAALDRDDEPDALPSGGADGMWLLLHREGR